MEEAKMRTLLILSCLLAGCQMPDKPAPPPPPKPTIKVSQSETNHNNSVVVYYVDHDQERQNNGYGEPHAVLRNIQDIKLYKAEVEFLLKRLDEAEKKMTIHEDPSNGQETTSP